MKLSKTLLGPECLSNIQCKLTSPQYSNLTLGKKVDNKINNSYYKTGYCLALVLYENGCLSLFWDCAWEVVRLLKRHKTLLSHSEIFFCNGINIQLIKLQHTDIHPHLAAHCQQINSKPDNSWMWQQGSMASLCHIFVAWEDFPEQFRDNETKDLTRASDEYVAFNCLLIFVSLLPAK